MNPTRTVRHTEYVTMPDGTQGRRIVVKRRRHMTRDELVAQVSADHDLPFEQINPVLDALAGLGVDVETLVKVTVDEEPA